MQTRNINASAIDEFSIDDIAELSVVDLLILQQEIDTAMALWKKRYEALQEGFHLKYGEQATALRHFEGKDSGTVNIVDDARQIKCYLTKLVEWDQAHLATLRQRIAAAGQNPDVYMQPEYKIKEAAFNSWPQNERDEFAGGRTVKVGKPKYTITVKDR